MSEEILSRVRYGEAFWRAHHETWRRSELNQREYCEAQGIPLKAFGNWRAKFKAEPQPAHKLLYRRGGLSHTLGHCLSHRLGHMTEGSPMLGPHHSAGTRGPSPPTAALMGVCYVVSVPIASPFGQTARQRRASQPSPSLRRAHHNWRSAKRVSAAASAQPQIDLRLTQPSGQARQVKS